MIFAHCGQEERDSSTLEGKSGVIASISPSMMEGIEEVVIAREKGHDGTMCPILSLSSHLRVRSVCSLVCASLSHQDSEHL